MKDQNNLSLINPVIELIPSVMNKESWPENAINIKWPPNAVSKCWKSTDKIAKMMVSFFL